jgi:ferritin-like metal-binding protein YciE
MAHEVGAPDAVTALTQNLNEEVEMAAWLDQHIQEVTQQYVALRATGDTAKK